MVDLIRSAIVPGSRVLEIGAGDSAILVHLAGTNPSSEFTGLDYAALGCELLQRRAASAAVRVTVCNQDLSRPPLTWMEASTSSIVSAWWSTSRTWQLCFARWAAAVTGWHDGDNHPEYGGGARPADPTLEPASVRPARPTRPTLVPERARRGGTCRPSGGLPPVEQLWSAVVVLPLAGRHRMDLVPLAEPPYHADLETQERNRRVAPHSRVFTLPVRCESPGGMKLLLFIHSLGAGGAERVLVTMANHWSEEGREVVLVTLAPRTDDRYATAPSVRRIELGTGQ